MVGFVDKALILPGLNFEHTSYIVSDSLPISTRPRSIRYNYYIYGSAVLTVSYLTDISVYNSKIIAVHSRSSIQNRNITSGCVDLPFKFDIKVKRPPPQKKYYTHFELIIMCWILIYASSNKLTLGAT